MISMSLGSHNIAYVQHKWLTIASLGMTNFKMALNTNRVNQLVAFLKSNVSEDITNLQDMYLSKQKNEDGILLQIAFHGCSSEIPIHKHQINGFCNLLLNWQS